MKPIQNLARMILLAALGAGTALAAESEGEVTNTIKPKADRGWVLLLHGGFGNTEESQVKEEEPYKQHRGSYFSGKFIGSRYSPRLVFDLGLGWNYTRIRGDEKDPTDGLTTNALIVTQAGVVEAGLRWRLTPYLETGLRLGEWIGPDLSFSSQDKEPRATTVLGLDAVFAMIKSYQVLRFRVGYDVELTVPKRQVSFLHVGLDFGLPLVKRDTVVRTIKVEEEKRTVTRREELVDVPVPVRVDVVREIIPGKMIPWTPASRNFKSAYFDDLGKAIAGLTHTFAKLQIRFVASELPQSASREAEATAAATQLRLRLIELGVPSDQVIAVGVVDDKLKPTAKGVRYGIELTFNAVSEMASLQAGLDKVKQRHAIPDTCEGEACK
jgi:hypothetical protein